MRLSIRALCLFSVFFLLAACSGTLKPLPPTTAYSGETTGAHSLAGKKIAVMGALSLAKVQQVAPKALADQQQTGASRYVAGKAPFFLTISAQFPYIMADALRKHGLDAQPSDRISLPEGTNKENARERMAALGYDYLLFVGPETSREKGRAIFKEERQNAKNITRSVLTLGLAPVHSSTFVLAYDRNVQLLSTHNPADDREQNFPVHVAEDELVSNFDGDYAGRYAKALNAEQQKDAAAIVRWLDGGGTEPIR